MSVGLYDQDLGIYQQFPFNLELMKLSSYYKKKRQIVKLTQSFLPEFYSIYHYQKDIDDGVYVPDLNKYKSLKYGGLAFSNGIYKPMELEIEEAQPDRELYRTVARLFSFRAADQEFFNALSKAQHLRLSLDGQTIFPTYTKQLLNDYKYPVIYLHDPNVTEIVDSYECLQDMCNLLIPTKRRYRVGSKFPLIFYNAEVLDKWLETDFIQNSLCTLQYYGLLPDEMVARLIDRYQLISFTKRLEYVVTYGCSTENDFFLNRLPQIYKQVLFLRSHKVKISLKYEKNFFSSGVGENTIRLIEAFCNSRFYKEIDLKYDSLYSFCYNMHEDYKYESTHIIKDEAREVFQFIRTKNYELFKQFYELHTVELKGGMFYEST